MPALTKSFLSANASNNLGVVKSALTLRCLKWLEPDRPHDPCRHGLGRFCEEWALDQRGQVNKARTRSLARCSMASGTTSYL